MATLAIRVQNIGIAFLILLALSSIAVHSDVVKEYNAAEGQIVCYECYNIVDGAYQPHCPKNGSVGPWAWKINCTGKCYTRTDDQNTDLIFRGCTDNQPFLPDPLPKDGCYPFYLETWCICSKNGCNGHAMECPWDILECPGEKRCDIESRFTREKNYLQNDTIMTPEENPENWNWTHIFRKLQ